jgi:flagellar biosynthesis/type III secretory pathway chaperone
MDKADTAPAAQLLRLLDTERAALLAGDLGALPRFVADKEALIATLEGAAPYPATLDRLRHAAASNQILLDAALRGMRAARERIEIARGGGPSLNTYDASGKAETRGTPRPSFERRA